MSVGSTPAVVKQSSPWAQVSMSRAVANERQVMGPSPQITGVFGIQGKHGLQAGGPRSPPVVQNFGRIVGQGAIGPAAGGGEHLVAVAGQRQQGGTLAHIEMVNLMGQRPSRRRRRLRPHLWG